MTSRYISPIDALIVVATAITTVFIGECDLSKFLTLTRHFLLIDLQKPALSKLGNQTSKPQSEAKIVKQTVRH